MVRRLGELVVLLFLNLALVACSNGVSVKCPDGAEGEEWEWDGRVCVLRRDGFNWSVSSITSALDGSDDLYVHGSFTYFKNQPVKDLVRLNNDGSLDTGFDIDSALYAPTVIAAATDGSGDVYLGAQLEHGNGTRPGIVRVNLDGSLDPAFDAGPGFGRSVSTVVPTRDGSGDVYVGGTAILGVATFENGPVRLKADGSRDTAFSPAFRSGENAIALAADGSGDVYVSLDSPPYIARLNDDGSLDTEFDTGSAGFDRSVSDIAVAVDGSGDIYVAGLIREYNGVPLAGLARLNNDGSLDIGFDVDDPAFWGGYFVIPLRDGSGDVYVHARNRSSQDIVRLNPDGSIDTRFGTGSGRFSGSLSDAAIATDGSGDVYVAGDITRYNSRPVAMLVRLTPSGKLVK